MKRKFPYILLLLFAALMVAGLMLGEYSTVLEQAITVCLSCIGIG
jgi:hypothetical protein